MDILIVAFLINFPIFIVIGIYLQMLNNDAKELREEVKRLQEKERR